MKHQESIRTDRLLIEPLKTSDSHFIFELVNTKEWKKFIGDRNIHSKEEALVYIQKILDNQDISYWVVKLPGQNIGIGVITFIKRLYLEYHDIGFAFLSDYSKKGYAYEAVNGVLSKLLPVYEFPKVLATTVPENKNSIKLLHKLGMRLKKEIMVGEERLQLYSVSSDHLRINRVVSSFFGVFSNLNQKQPDWKLLHHLCIPQALLISKKESGQVVYNLTSFVEPRKKILNDGTLTEFEEHEISGKTQIQTNIAQRHSRYQKNGVMGDKPFVELGNKFFQFVKTPEGWRITSVIWEDDRS